MSFFNEVKRRNVHRMVVLYALTSWLIMQAAEVIMTLAALPEWTGQITLMLLALGFPIALILSWFYELTPEGVSLERDVDVGKSLTHVTGRRMDFIVIAVLCAAVLLFAFDKWWASGPPIMSIAVLPLDDFSGDLQQPGLADGLTDVLTAELGQIGNLKVTSRTSAKLYDDTDIPLPEIATELGVDAIVEGSIQTAGDEVWLTIQLIDGRTDRHLWARSYQRDLQDVLTLQGNIARTIANEVRMTLTPQSEARLSRERTADAAALRLWVIGNYHLKGYSFDQALEAFKEASSRDPEFADAYAGIAQAYAYLGSWFASEKPSTVLPRAKSAAEQAIRLDPDLAEAHFALGEIHKFQWNWEAAEREFQIGVEMNPSDTTGLILYVNFLGTMGRFDEAIEVGMRAVELDPFSPSAYTELGQVLSFAGRTEEAQELYEKALQLDPDFYWAQWLLAEFYIAKGEYQIAGPYMERIRRNFDITPPSVVGLLGHLYAIAGRHDDARAILSKLLDRRETQFIPASALAYIYLGLEDYESTLAWLEVAYEERNYQLTWLNQDYLFNGLRDDPRFQEILARMNFPEP